MMIPPEDCSSSSRRLIRTRGPSGWILVAIFVSYFVYLFYLFYLIGSAWAEFRFVRRRTADGDCYYFSSSTTSASTTFPLAGFGSSSAPSGGGVLSVDV